MVDAELTATVAKWSRTGLLRGLDDVEAKFCALYLERLFDVVIQVMSFSVSVKRITNVVFPIQRRVFPLELDVDLIDGSFGVEGGRRADVQKRIDAIQDVHALAAEVELCADVAGALVASVPGFVPTWGVAVRR